MSERRRLNWPRRCARCGATDDLMWLDVRAARRNRPLRERRWTWKSLRYELWWYQRNGPDSLPIPVPMCGAHAASNRLGGILLSVDYRMKLLRLAVYVGFGGLLQFAIQAIAAGAAPVAALRELPPALLGLFACAAVGAMALVWADHVAWIRPLRLDRARETAVLRLRNERDAAEFLRTNPGAAPDTPASRLSTWLHPTPPQALAVVLFALIAMHVVSCIGNH